jgi:HEPN domain-containing protein
MNPEKKEIINGWYEKADEDFLAAEVVIDASPLLYDVSAFHSQQAAEKYIKAFLAFNEIMPPKVHNIKELIDLAVRFDASFEAIREAESLSKYAVRSRYPDDFDIDTKEQALKILGVARSVKDFVRNKIGI